jgi:hypothetical protein
MKHIKFTYVDALTGISVASHPAINGPINPPVKGLQFMWARESRYPTDAPEMFGTCDQDANTCVDGVLQVLSQAEWEQLRAEEMDARVPKVVTMRQARMALLHAGHLSAVDAIIDSMPEPERSAAKIDWEYAQEVQRYSPLVTKLSSNLQLSKQDVDELFTQAARL